METSPTPPEDYHESGDQHKLVALDVDLTSLGFDVPAAEVMNYLYPRRRNMSV